MRACVHVDEHLCLCMSMLLFMHVLLLLPEASFCFPVLALSPLSVRARKTFGCCVDTI
jgi:hypothetical protein